MEKTALKTLISKMLRRNPQAALEALTEQPTDTDHTPLPDMIAVSMSAMFHNKHTLPDQELEYRREVTPELFPAFSKSFKRMTIPPRQFAETATRGAAWAVGVYQDNHRVKSKFISSQVLALDFDDSVSVAELLDNPFVRRFAAFLYPSPSSTPDRPKSRAVFVLDGAVTDIAIWERMQQALIHKFADYNPDSKCKDGARFYYGSDVHGAVFMRQALPVGVIATSAEYISIIHSEQDAQRQREIKREQFTANGDVNYTAYIDTVLRNVAMEGSGGRNDALFKAACALFTKRREEGWDISDAALERELIAVAQANGLAKDDGLHSVEKTIESARRRA
jgi:hypothetical protein